MQPYRKLFAIDPLFPFEIVYHTEKKPDKELPDHLHDHYELVYVHSGTGIFFIDQTWYTKDAGDLFLIPGNTIHRSMPELEDPIVSSAVFFAPAFLTARTVDDAYHPLMGYEAARRKKMYRLSLPSSLRETAESSLRLINDEMSERQPGYRDAVRMTLEQLLLKINRYLLSDLEIIHQSEGPRMGPPWMLRAINKIDEHPERENSLVSLAKEACVSPAHFSRVFRQLTTLHFSGYVNAKRIILAKDKLLHSDENINLIAEQCGFETPAHFYRVFKSLTGETPGMYRDRNRR